MLSDGPLIPGHEKKVGSFRYLVDDYNGLSRGAFRYKRIGGGELPTSFLFFTPMSPTSGSANTEQWYNHQGPSVGFSRYERIPGTESYIKQFSRDRDFREPVYSLLKMLDAGPALIRIECDALKKIDEAIVARTPGLRDNHATCKVETREALLKVFRFVDKLSTDQLVKAGPITILRPVRFATVVKANDPDLPTFEQFDRDRDDTCRQAAKQTVAPARLVEALNCT